MGRKRKKKKKLKAHWWKRIDLKGLLTIAFFAFLSLLFVVNAGVTSASFAMSYFNDEPFHLIRWKGYREIDGWFVFVYLIIQNVVALLICFCWGLVLKGYFEARSKAGAKSDS